MSRPRSTLLTVVLLLTLTAAAHCQPWPRVEQPAQGVTILYDDFGDWGGGSMGTSHQVNPSYQVRKTIDLSGLPEGALAAAKEARLRVFFACQDYSWNLPDIEWNGLDESFELHVNGHVHTYPTDCGFPASAKKSEPLRWHWDDFIIPVHELVPGKNVFLFRKVASNKPKNDDYVYVGIDGAESHGNSAVSFDGGKTWTSEKLNHTVATGEYMVRLVLIARKLGVTATWRPEVGGRLDDPAGLVGHMEPGGEQTKTGLRLTPNSTARLEFDVHVIDDTKPISAQVQFAGTAPTVAWVSRDGDALEAETTVADGKLTSVVPAKLERPWQLTLTARKEGETELRLVTVKFMCPYMDAEPVVDMAPRISPPRGGPIRLAPRCEVLPNRASLRDSLLECRLETRPRLRMVSLVNRWVGRDVLLDPERTHLFVVEIGDERFGAEDFTVRNVTALEDAEGLAADLFLQRHALRARLTIALAEAGQLKLGLKLTNEGNQPLDFKTAFPHLRGLRLSNDWRDDYYLFPFYGGIIADVPTYLRTAYGENTAWWQMIDLFSPSGGGGLCLRCLDEKGLYKCPALRKGKTFGPGYSITFVGYGHMDRSLPWCDSLDPGQGTAMTFEYLKRTRGPGESFSPPDTMIAVHAGDWHVAMSQYSQWAHTVWKWRPYPSKLRDCYNISSVGWGQSPLYKDGAYRTDFIKEDRDGLELMAWWAGSEVGPWRVPLEQALEKLGETFYKKRKEWWVPSPITGKPIYRLNCPDYRYDDSRGGLPTLRNYIKTIRDAGILPMFYMNGRKVCDSSEIGHKYGLKYGIKNPRWSDSQYKTGMTPKGYVGSYAAFQMCSDTKWWQDYLARTVKRICADTGIAGVRLDEYGHPGCACESAEHEHIFAEPGHNGCLQGTSEACRKVHAAMDEVAPELVLWTEYPGYDHLAQYLEASIIGETRPRHVKAIRPVPCNLFRFYFPECKGYELGSHGTPHAEEWMFWNATGAYARLHPPRYHRILRENADLFESGEREPLIPTLVQRVYANRFTSKGKQITLLYNARGYTVDGTLVLVQPKKGHHFFELLRCEELPPAQTNEGYAVGLKLRRDHVACIARLPNLLTVARDGNRLAVQVAGETQGMRIALAGADGKLLLERPAAARIALTVPETAPGRSQQPVCVKLLGKKYLADAAALP